MKRLRLLFLLVAGVFLISACSSAPGGGAPAFSYAGNWNGTVSDTVVGEGVLTATMTQSDTTIGGTWMATYPSGDSNSGQLVGVINGSEVLIDMMPSNPGTCPFAAVVVRSGSNLSGTYSAYNCSVSVSGTININKQ